MSQGLIPAGSSTPKVKDPLEFIRVWRDQLIDLTKKNKLLSFKAPKTSSITIAQPDAHQAASLLLGGGHVPLVHLRIVTEVEPSDETVDPNAEKPPSWQRREHLSPATLYADILELELRVRATAIERRTAQEFLDRGLWTLYIAFGQVVWRDVDNEFYRAPLLLIPVTITPSNERASWRLTRTDEDVVLNPALQIKAERLGIKIPHAATEQEDFDPEKWIREVNESVETLDGWHAEASAVLSRFSFSKEVMYRDLLENEDAIAAHNVIRAIIDPESAGLPESEFVDPTSVDQLLPPEITPLIRDADSSQRAAIATALAGSSLVIDGPPGTGKSQTIANLIGAFLYQKQTVLFVSEKAAALEVVKDRLSEAGLGDYVLELHSHRATRKQVAAALGDALQNRPKPPRPMSDAEFSRVRSLRKELTDSAEAANKIREPLGRSFNAVAGVVASMTAIPNAPECALDFGAMTLDLLSEVQRIGERARHSWRPVSERNHFPWRGARGRMPYESKISRTQLALSDLEAAVDPFSGWINTFKWKLSNLPELIETISVCQLESDLIIEAWLTTPNLDEATRAIATLERILGVHLKASVALSSIIDTNSPILKTAGLPDFTRIPMKQDAWPELQTDDIQESARTAHRLADLAIKFQSAATATDQLLELDTKTDFVGAQRRLKLLRLVTSELKPLAAWLNAGTLAQVDEAADRIRSVWADEIDARQTAQKCWTEQILSQDIGGLQTRFANIHRGLRRLSGAYREDKQILVRAGQPAQKAKNLEAALKLASDWQSAVRRREIVEKEFSPTLSTQYRGEGTNWLTLTQRVETGREIKRLLTTTLNASQTKCLTGDGEIGPAIQSVFLPAIAAYVSEFENDLPHLPETSSVLRRRSAADLITDLHLLIKWINQSTTTLSEITPYLNPDIVPTLGCLRDICVHQAVRLAAEQELNSLDEDAVRALDSFYKGPVQLD